MAWTLEGKGNFVWPDELLRKSHAKGNSKGEIEDILADLETAKKIHDGISDFPFPKSKAGKDVATGWADDAQAFFSGSKLKKLVGSLKVISTRVDKLSKTPKLSKEAKASLKTIKASIDEHVESVGPAAINPQIAKTVAVMMKADKEFIIKSLKTVFSSYKACAGKKHPGITKAALALKAWPVDPGEQDKVRAEVGTALYDDCRDMTQNLQNMVKAIEYGGDMSGLEDRDIKTIPKIAKTLIPIANAKSGVGTGKSRDELVALVRTVKVNADLFDEIAKRVP